MWTAAGSPEQPPLPRAAGSRRDQAGNDAQGFVLRQSPLGRTTSSPLLSEGARRAYGLFTRGPPVPSVTLLQVGHIVASTSYGPLFPLPRQNFAVVNRRSSYLLVDVDETLAR
jgi:hypothetical protein